jgi:hypothetical protein
MLILTLPDAPGVACSVSADVVKSLPMALLPT